MEAYCLYLRKSRSDLEAESRGEGETLARHERVLLDLAKSRGYNVTQIYREVVSGETIADRPVMQRLLREVERGLWTGVLVVEVERLARGDTVDQGTVARAFKYSNTEIITPFKTFDPNNEYDEQFFEFNLFMSRQEYRAIKRRLLQGRESAVREGKYVSGSIPFGYDHKKIKNGKGWTLSINEPEAETVRLIFELYVTPEILPDGTERYLGTIGVAHKLDALKRATPSGLPFWSGDTVCNILKNPVYVGKICWGRRRTRPVSDGGVVSKKRYKTSRDEWTVVDGLHPAIVSQEIFDRAAALMDKKSRPPVPKFRTLVNPLAGVVYCAKCGRCMSYRVNARRPSLACPNNHCDNVSAYFDLVEKRLLESLSGWLSEYRLEWESDAPSDDSAISLSKKSLAIAEKNVSALEAQLSRTYDLLEQGVYDTDTFLERSRDVSGRIAAAKKDVEELKKSLSDLEQRNENKKNVIPKVEKILEVYETLPDAQSKNELLKDVLEKATYLRLKRSSKSGPFDNFELTLFPKLPDSRN